jgi:uncharacterized transporter YbjL
VTKIVKEFPGPSVDNPVLLRQFAQTLAKRYAEMFPAARGFALELKENTIGKIRGWEITILHGFLSGAMVSISPNRGAEQQISINVMDHSRLQQLLTKVAAVLALVMAAPPFVLGLLRGRLLIALIAGGIVCIVAGLVLTVIVLVICRLFKRFNHYFNHATQQQILAIANQFPLPTTIDRSDLPTPPPPHPSPAAIPAFPARRGPYGIGR